MISMPDEQVLECFKEAFPPKAEAQLLEIDVINLAIGKMRVLILLGQNCHSPYIPLC